MRKHLFIMLFCLLTASCGMQESILQSPNKAITVVYDQTTGFTVKYKSNGVRTEVFSIARIGMGLESDTFALVSCSPQVKVTDDYEMPGGKRKHCYNQANECTYQLVSTEGKQLELVLRAYNDGVAFRYHIPQTTENDMVVTDEHTTIRFAPDIQRWTQPFVVGYEGFYQSNTDGKGHNRGHHWGLPALFQPSADTYVLLAEANVLKGNCGAYLSNEQERSIYKTVLSEKQLTCPAGWYSPWRLAIIGSLADVVESTLVTDVSEPCRLEDTSWIKPGVVSWIYWAHNHGSKDYQIVKQYVDFADSLDLPYVLIDAEWDEMTDGKTIEDALAYSHSKGVKPMIWYNSSVGWIHGAPGPKFRLNKPEDREREFAWCEQLGVAGVKIDFFSDDNLMNMDYYIDLMECAARHHLLVNFHGATIPRGWQRTYPHMLTMEAVYGAEWYNNVPTYTDRAASHNTTLPFTRNVIGPMDYTPCAFTDSQHPHITSDAHELALLVVFESALQHLADRPEGFLAQPAEVQTFVSHLPAAWDDTKLLAGYPGESVAMARRSGDTWYVGIINGKDEPQTLDIDWSLLGTGEWQATTFADKGGGQKAWVIQSDQQLFTSKLPARIDMQPRGGFVAVLKKK